MSAPKPTPALTRKATPFALPHARPHALPRRTASNHGADADADSNANANANATSAPKRIPRRSTSGSDNSLRTQLSSTALPTTTTPPTTTRRRAASKARLSTTAMRDYNANSDQQRAAVRLGLDALSRGVGSLPAHLVSPTSNVRFVDFGASHGRNSALPVGLVLGLVGDAVASVEVVHQDLPSNDFSALFQCVASPNSPDSYLPTRSQTNANVFCLASAGSFYDRLFPDASVTLGFSSTAVHWLSEPSPLRGVLSHALLPAERVASDPDARAQLDALVALARRDWAAYVAHRERELVPGGQLVHVDICRGDAPPHAAPVDAAADADSQCFGRIDGLFVLAQRLLAETFGADEEFTQPVYVRSRAEFLDPFTSGASKLVVREATVTDVPDVLFETAERGDARAYAERVAGFFRAAAAPSLRLEQRFGAERVRGFYEALVDAVARDPAAYRVSWRVLVLRLERPA